MSDYERNDAEFLRIIAPLMFGFADKTFKFVSWLIVIAAIGVAQRATQSSELLWLLRFLEFVYVITLGVVVVELAMRGFPKSKHVPPVFGWAMAILLFAFGMLLFLMISIPLGGDQLLIDQILKQLSQGASPP